MKKEMNYLQLKVLLNIDLPNDRLQCLWKNVVTRRSDLNRAEKCCVRITKSRKLFWEFDTA